MMVQRAASGPAMIIVLYCLGLLVLLAGPILARWRSGFLLALIVTLVELGAVAGLFYYLAEHGYLRGEPSPGEMTPTRRCDCPPRAMSICSSI
jgi:hypothetical protein